MTQSTTPAPSASVAVSKENTVNQKTKNQSVRFKS
ncbi:ribosomal RNA large subunit methyltransferase N [Proteus mirabilis]|uniref:Ribosomal RNA large subunit methyltransferase N n=1 Tax=Proteus mirabilis TaxID=584 RepID=A0A2X2DK64_PROMI|nr:ribosomal RNA large subunit methyltransferase N [Proteus mirabilis]